MKYNGNINYIKCLEFGLNLSQWAVMDLLGHLSTWAEGKEIDWQIYYYISAKKMTEELPIVSEKKDTFLKILQKLKEKNLVEHKIFKNKWFYRLTELGKSFIRQVFDERFEEIEEKSRCGNKSIPGMEKNPHNNNTNYNILFGAEEKTKEELLEILDEIIESFSSVISKSVRKTFSLEQNFFKFLRNWKFENESIFRDAWNTACQNYYEEIQWRNPNKDYAKHRFSLSEFLTQKNGFAKYLNK